jgi:hypothetical protein
VLATANREKRKANQEAAEMEFSDDEEDDPFTADYSEIVAGLSDENDDDGKKKKEGDESSGKRANKTVSLPLTPYMK